MRDMQIISSPCFGVMNCFKVTNCFSFSNGDKDSEPRTSKSISLVPSSISGCDMRTTESEFGSNVSEISTESPARITFTSFSQRHNYLREFSVSELKIYTKNFSRSEMVGEGGFGGVYRGIIQSTDDPDKKIDIAVKQLSRRGLQGHKEWVTEVNVLGIVEHPNLVKLIGYCAEDDERGIQRLLVYEYLSNGSVQDHLSRHFHAPLPWNVRLKIAQGAAQGLAYLHEGMEFQIIFRDFKSSNILLDDQWNAKLSDFGLARLGPSDGFSHVTTAVVGTIGYAAPEYIQTGRLTSKSDVWSYGVFLYELITGRRPYERNRPKNEQKLLEWIRPHLSDVKKFRLIIDSRLEGKYSFKSVQKLASIANRCLIRNHKNRPKMSQVVEMLNVIINRTEIATSPRTPTPNLCASDNAGRRSTSERLKRTLVDPIIGESGRLALQSWRSKIMSTN